MGDFFSFLHVMHILLFPFKIMFIVVPPPGIGGGWPCFIISIIFIGVITFFVNDMATVLGCLLGIIIS